MKRINSRILRHSAEMSPATPHNAEYVGKHESLVDSIAEILDELCEALDITEEFIAEITAPARKMMAEVAAKVRKTMGKYLPRPEFHPARNYLPLGMEAIPYAGV